MSVIDLREIVREVVAELLVNQLPLATIEQNSNTKPSRSMKRTRRKSSAPRDGRSWGMREKRQLIDLMTEGKTVQEAAAELGRSWKAVDDRLWHRRYGLLVNPDSGHYATAEGQGPRKRLELAAGQVGIRSNHGGGFLDKNDFFDLFSDRL